MRDSAEHREGRRRLMISMLYEPPTASGRRTPPRASPLTQKPTPRHITHDGYRERDGPLLMLRDAQDSTIDYFARLGRRCHNSGPYSLALQLARL